MTLKVTIDAKFLSYSLGMDDRLVGLLQYFELRARVFQAGPLCRSTHYDQANGLGYLHVLRHGSVELRSPDHSSFQLHEPSLVMYLSPTTHELKPIGDATELVCASFELGAGGSNPLSTALPEVVWIHLSECPGMSSALELLFGEANEQHCGRQAVLDRMMEVVFIQVLRELMDQRRIKAGLVAGLSDLRLSKALMAVHKQPGQSWTLEDLALEAGMSRARFAARFRDIVGITPGAYLNQWRLMVAQSLLLQGKPLQLVADKVGYASSSALARVFKEKVGESPGKWARRHH